MIMQISFLALETTNQRPKDLLVSSLFHVHLKSHLRKLKDFDSSIFHSQKILDCLQEKECSEPTARDHFLVHEGLVFNFLLDVISLRKLAEIEQKGLCVSLRLA